MPKFALTVAAGARGAVIRKEIDADIQDPWPRALQVASQAIKKGDGQLRVTDQQLTLLLTPVTK